MNDIIWSFLFCFDFIFDLKNNETRNHYCCLKNEKSQSSHKFTNHQYFKKKIKKWNVIVLKNKSDKYNSQIKNNEINSISIF